MGEASSLGGTAAMAAAATAGTGGLAAPLSLASMGLSAFSSIMQGEGVSAADTYKAETLDRAAQYGELTATQTNAQMTRNLNITLGNIDAVRAASHDDPTSPTGAALRDTTEALGTERKNIAVDSITAQAQEDEANAAYLREASSAALLSGDLTAGAGLLGKNGIAGLPMFGGGTGTSI
jgi:hypothetical protein